VAADEQACTTDGCTELDHRIAWSTLGHLDDLRHVARSIIAHLDS
jgi:hypothetical protein